MLASRLLGYCLEHALNHLVSREDAMLATVLLVHMRVRLSGEVAIFLGVLPEHALVYFESSEDVMFAGVISSTSRATRMRRSRACCWITQLSTLQAMRT